MSYRETFSATDHLVSTTDLSGTILYANEKFAKIAGFSSDELIGQPHNIVRHPDMPKEAFKSLWGTIKAGRSWMGMVMNRCKDGNYYWVDAYVSPVMKGGKIIGYQSVRSAPDEKTVSYAESFYKKITQGAAPRLTNLLSFKSKVLLSAALPPLGLIAGNFIGATIGYIIAGSSLALAAAALMTLARSWDKLVDSSKQIIDDDLARKIYTQRGDEIGNIELAMHYLQAKTTTILTRAEESTNDLETLADQTNSAVQDTDSAILEQQSELGQVSSAVTEMSAAINEVSNNTLATSNAAEEANHSVQQGQDIIERSLSETNALAESLASACDTIEKLGEDSASIKAVMDVISSIADQTNLLALNAAIEAARAGEQGRGFAVVADEVRTLAQRTQQSTEEIKTIVDQLSTSSMSSVQAMRQAREQAGECVNHNQDAGQAYHHIGQAVTTIKDMSLQVAAAVEEQSLVAEEVSTNINNIQARSDDTANASQRTAKTSVLLQENIQSTKEMIRQFSQ